MTRTAVAGWAARCCRVVVLATVLLSPTQWSVKWGLAHFTLADPLIIFATLCWAAKIALLRDWTRFRRLPWQVVAFLVPALLSVFAAEHMPLALRDLSKFFEYFLLGYLLYDDLLHRHPHALQTVLTLLAATLVLNELLALGQYVLASDPLQVRGAFGNRNVLAGWLALALPVAFGVGLYTDSRAVRVAAGLALLLGLLVDLSAASLGAVLCVITFVAATRGWRPFALTALAATLWLGLAAPHVGWFHDRQTGERQSNLDVVFRSLALYAPDGQPERRYPEWQSAAEMLLTNPWLGEGAGNYQRRIGLYTGNKPSFTGPNEPDTQNLFLVIGSTLGIPALLGFLAMLLVPGMRVGAAAARYTGWRRGLSYGVAGGIAAFAITANWHPLLVRGIGLHLVLMLVLARLLATWTLSEERTSERVA